MLFVATIQIYFVLIEVFNISLAADVVEHATFVKPLLKIRAMDPTILRPLGRSQICLLIGEMLSS
jgi:hypothetical protein